MPPTTRRAKVSKLKENFVAEKSTPKNAGKPGKPLRKPLADKTNSASDDNASFELPKKPTKKASVSIKTQLEIVQNNVNKARPRRERRVPSRYIENDVLKRLSSNKDGLCTETVSNLNKSNISDKSSSPVTSSTFKTLQKGGNDSLIANRSKRICRLPARFEDHSISPSKFIPLKPCHASTPVNNAKNVTLTQKNKASKVNSNSHEIVTNGKPSKKTTKFTGSNVKTKPDTNNNPKQIRMRGNGVQSPKKKIISTKTKISAKKPFNRNFSFKVLEDKPNKETAGNDHDVYEFTFDPSEEPQPPQKKKPKRIRKKPSKPRQPKVFIFKNNYHQNLSKTLAGLKQVMTKKTQKLHENLISTSTSSEQNILIENKTNASTTNTEDIFKPSVNGDTVNSLVETNRHSIQIENIAADFAVPELGNDINYSPVSSPHHPNTNDVNDTRAKSIENLLNSQDPLNLKDDHSFFDEQPVASSSMNISTRNPLASPWRADFTRLPIKWLVNTYVKPNMTPALESSYVNLSDSKVKKHRYTNIGPELEEALPRMFEDVVPKLKQSSIISFIKEAAERSAKKKNKRRSCTPTKANAIFEDYCNNIINIDIGTDINTSRKLNTPRKETSNSEMSANTAESDDNIPNDRKNCKEAQKRKNNSDPNVVPAKTPHKDVDDKFFGFDSSENLDQENVSLCKKVKNNKVRSLRSRSKAVLKEINEQKPLRAALPAKSKFTASSDTVNKLYEQIKSATEAPEFVEKDIPSENIETPVFDDLIEEDSDSVHLFKDIDVVHHVKPVRKSYGKAKKVTFLQQSNSDAESQDPCTSVEFSDGDLADLSFEIPKPTKKKTTKRNVKKQKISKKEEQEAEAWAEEFNSMCEDVEEFDLVVE